MTFWICCFVVFICFIILNVLLGRSAAKRKNGCGSRTWDSTDKTPVDITVSQIIFPAKSHCSPLTQGEQSVRFPLILGGYNVWSYVNVQSLKSQGNFCMSGKSAESKINLVLQMFSVLLTHPWGAISTWCCVDPTDILGTPVQHLLSQTAAQVHTWLCPTPLLQFGGSGVCHTGCTWVTSSLTAANRTISLWDPFSVRLAHIPVGLQDGSSLLHMTLCERGWCLGCAEPSSPFLLPLWSRRARSHFCFMWISCVLGWGGALSSWETLHLWVGPWVVYACSSYCLIRQFN